MHFDGTSGPQVIVEVSFTVNPDDDASTTIHLVLDSPDTPLDTGTLSDAISWTDVTDDCISVNATRGRTDETQPVDLGTGSIVLDNSQAQYDPNNPGSPFYVSGVGSSVKPMAQVRVRALFGSNSWTLFRGYIEDFDFDMGTQATVTLDCIDTLSLFGALTLDPVTTALYAGDSTGARLNRLANLVGWPSSLRDIETGEVTMNGTLLGDTALALAQRCQNAEMGMLWVRSDGYLAFLDQNSLFTRDRSVNSQTTFADTGSFPEFNTLVLKYGASGVYNIVTLTRSNDDAALPQTAEDSDSIDLYGQRSYPNQDDLDVSTDYEVQYHCQFLLARYKDPSVKVTELTVEALTQPQYFAQLADLDLWDRITINRTYTSSYTFAQDLWLEGVTIDITQDSFLFTFSTSRSASAPARPFILDSSKLDSGFLGVGTEPVDAGGVFYPGTSTFPSDGLYP